VKKEYLKWYSPTLNVETEMFIYGHYGKPVIIFPTTMGRYYESTDFGLITSASHLVNEGKVKFYCVDSIDKFSWYNKAVHPSQRVQNHIWYDQFIVEEVIRPIQQSYGIQKVAVAGASFGAFHAANFAFRHPDLVSDMIAMSGAFDVNTFMDGHYDDNVYFNNPVDYMQNANHPDIWQMKIILGVGEWDICLEPTNRMAGILTHKNIPHWYDLRIWAKHDWPLWRDMFPDYVGSIV
jgi:esterase/lipase superfamily enzyme